MNRDRLWLVIVAAGLLIPVGNVAANEMGTAFTYQGELTEDTTLVTDTCDFEFKLWDASGDPDPGNQVGSTLPLPNVPVEAGRFTVKLDFGADIFTGEARWLELAVCCPSTCTPEPLDGRQELTPAPYAFALPGLWTQQNAENVGPNLVAGYVGNSVTPGVVGATIGGGGGNVNPGDGRCSDDPEILCASDADCPSGTCEPDEAVGRCVHDPEILCETDDDCPSGPCLPSAAPNRVVADYGTVGGGHGNVAGGEESPGKDSADGRQPIGIASTVAGGLFNTAWGLASTIGGGVVNRTMLQEDTIAGGSFNLASGPEATIGGGLFNNAIARGATLGGGGQNTASGFYSTVGGGAGNFATGSTSTVAGGDNNNASASEATVSGGTNNTASDHGSSVGGGSGNIASGYHSTVSGGFANTASNHYATVGGGNANTASLNGATIGGGSVNGASGWMATVGGGSENSARGQHNTIAGGDRNETDNTWATVGGGMVNTATNSCATVGGGGQNSAGGWYATVPGGRDNSAEGQYSFAAGRNAKANHNGTFLWADSSNFDFPSTATDEFSARATGGVRFVTAIDGAGTPIAGVKLDPGDNAWEILSDRNAKENFVTLDTREILRRLSDLPVTQWNYKGQDPSDKHIGPMAQDFFAAFGLSADDHHISTIDADGVALAAIQGLYEIVKEKDRDLQTLQTENEELKDRLAALEAAVAGLTRAAGRNGGAR